MSVIPEWRQAWRMLSVQVASAAVLFGAMPTDTQAAILDLIGLPPSRLPAVLGLLMIVGRLWAQPKVESGLRAAEEDAALWEERARHLGWRDGTDR